VDDGDRVTLTVLNKTNNTDVGEDCIISLQKGTATCLQDEDTHTC
jgi:hypothetical protein